MINSLLVSFVERLFFRPNLFDWVIISLLSPLSLLLGTLMLLRRLLTPKKHYDTPIISVGNLTVGGSGKTPFVIALAQRYEGATIISRGYGRQSQGLVEVSREGEILCDVLASGDEPMLMAKSLPMGSVIVSENRLKAIDLAIKQGAKLIILDDGFNRVNIQKFEILLHPKVIKNPMPFPAGAFREFYFTRYFADLNLVEGRDFERHVSFEHLTERMLLTTAISNPQRLKPFLPKGVVGEFILEDHAYFDEQELSKQMQKFNATSLLVTQKDAVKMEGFVLPLSIMELRLEILAWVWEEIDNYLADREKN